MRKFAFLILSSLLAAGCSMANPGGQSTVRELEYRKILIMPFTEGPQTERESLYRHLEKALSSSQDIEVVGGGRINEAYLSGLGITHPLSFGPLDFSGLPEGEGRRQQLIGDFGADAAVFGTLAFDGSRISLNVQMLDLKTGEMTLGFPQEAQSSPDDQTLADLAEACAEKILIHVRENWVETTIHRY